ncbi:SpaA isopeptide-forming pilin-related protein [Bifidobacterium adolescentis]|uniref:SpaA isopeptide-forming pilin-related protein n=1 Tax=Bifidobacterium adolescentis TaxID=1680 RepID=UPI001C2446B0|nr:SpaA isopeptide-forming pilin-related protein [Bifidobacterium adolescentis]MBU9011226.1 prealbumin-like fold domain-containing protein [Bifidobacterium adolescentis]MBU9080759.1 prealbumin-like fold domain-containing protein [Bifidobacterium adolescentis]MBU9102550.1 prealbumin-like fold domain-containing protein [Bifidobacterium adolescentis]MBU9103958.1 prealbumin-like fold domain-containing protein [Bifidobacterium adolescentis]
MKAKSWVAGIAAAATLFAAMTAPASAMAEEATAPGAPQTSANCATAGNAITVKGKDADAFKIWNGKTSSGSRTFSVAKVADYKIGDGASGGVHLETVKDSKNVILQAVKKLKFENISVYVDEDLQGDPMNWLANNGNDTLIREYVNDPGVTGTAHAVEIDDTNKTMTLTMSDPGLYVIFDDTNPKQQIKDTGDATVEYDGFSNMLVGTPLTDGCKVTANSKGVVDLTSDPNAKTGSTMTKRGGFHFTKVGVNGAGLSGAEFTVYSDASFMQALKDAATDEEVRVTSNSEGRVDFSGFKLSAGTYYLKETKVPDGYWSGSAAKLQVKMKNDNGQIKLESITEMNPKSGLLSGDSTSGYIYRNVKNITQLPLTGAMGMAILGVVAVLCIGGASIIIVRARKTKRSFAA